MWSGTLGTELSSQGLFAKDIATGGGSICSDVEASLLAREGSRRGGETDSTVKRP